MAKPLSDVVKAFLLSLLDTGYAPSEIRAAFKECGFVTDPERRPSLDERVALAKAEIAKWPPEKHASMQLQGCSTHKGKVCANCHPNVAPEYKCKDCAS